MLPAGETHPQIDAPDDPTTPEVPQGSCSVWVGVEATSATDVWGVFLGMISWPQSMLVLNGHSEDQMLWALCTLSGRLLFL